MQPTLLDVKVFDATEDYAFSYVWSGPQAMGSKLTVRNNETDEVVYTGTYMAMSLRYVLPGGSLTNGVEYNCTLEVLDAGGEVISDPSNSEAFWCYSTPTFRFSNIAEFGVIENSNFEAQLEYLQDEGDLLYQYQIMLCDLEYNVLQKSGIKSGEEHPAYTLNALENDTNYILRATGKTKAGFILDTGYIRVYVHYIQPSLFAGVELHNNRDSGTITFVSNMIAIDGVADHEPVIYIDGEKADLRDNKVSFPEGFY